MRRYLQKILPAAAIVLVFAVVININMPRNLDYYARNIGLINNNPKMAGSCTTGTGTLKYVTATSLNIRPSASTSGASLGQLSKCTQVRVYCTSGSWSKISKVSDKWVSTGYLSSSMPSGCSNKTTTTDKINFSLSTPTTMPAAGYTKMYSDKLGTIKLDVTGITNVASDDNRLFNVVVKKGTTVVTNKFDITKSSVSGGKMSITLKMNSISMSSGSYTIEVTAGTVTKNASFSLVGKYYDFTINTTQTSNHENNPPNEKNTWEIDLHKDGIPDNNDFSINITRNGLNYNNKFNITLDGDTYKISNKTPYFSRPSSGEYVITINYYNPDYSTANGTISRTTKINFGYRNITFNKNLTESSSHRYIRTKLQKNYTINVVSKTVTNGVTYYTFIENGETVKMSEAEFKEIYTDFDVLLMNFANNGNILYYYSEACRVTHYLAGNITYLTATNEKKTLDEATFKATFPGVFEGFSKGQYTFAADGALRYVKSGVKVLDNVQLDSKNRNVFSTVGGEFHLVYDYAQLDAADFANASVNIRNSKGQPITESDGFKFSWTYDATKVYIKIVYDNQDEKYTDAYTVYIDFEDVPTIEVGFSLYEADIDFYLMSQYDEHLGSPDQLTTGYPPSNSKYEYYLGFYLMQFGSKLEAKNAKTITVNIYDHLADLDSAGNIFFYNQVNYETRILKYLNGNVTYQVSLDGGPYTTHTESLANFKAKYKDAAELISMYNYDSSGNITSDKNRVHITRYYHVEALNDMEVEFYTTNPAQKETMVLAEFKVKYPDVYAYLMTRFVFDNSGNIVLGGVMGSYRVTTENGKPIVGKEVTNQFNITIDSSPSELEKAITILPKNEVEPGRYYTYVSYDSLQGVGYVNNSSDAVIGKDQYPEMWNQNIHMTSITYSEPVYEIGISEPVLSNVGNTQAKMYNNIEGSALFNIDLKNIYTLSGLTYAVQYYNGTSWINANDHFVIENLIETENPSFKLTSLANIKKGKYRLVLNYQNKGQTCTSNQEFEVSGKYYGLVIDKNTNVSFIHNYTEDKDIFATGHFISNPDNIIPSIKRKVVGGNDEQLKLDETKKQFTNSAGQVVFKYNYQHEENRGDNDQIRYQFTLTNQRDVTEISEYELTFSYTETGNETSTSTVDFEVTDNQYIFNIENEVPRATETETTLTMDINTKYINYDDLDRFEYVIYYHTGGGKYIDVSSNNSTKKMFSIVDRWDSLTSPDYKGKIIITLNNNVDLDGTYYIEARFRDNVEQKNITSLRRLFAWTIDDIKITGTYHDKIIDEAGNEVEQPIILDKFYRNISDTQIEVMLNSFHENNAKWTINKECLEATCDPTTGTNFNNRFVANNKTGSESKLVLSLAEGAKMDPGVYALTIYYSATDYQVYRLEVFSDYVFIEMAEPIVYSKINNDKIIGGLYTNKNGTIYIPTTVRGINYNDVNITVTDLSGNSYASDLTFNKEDFISERALTLNYALSSALIPQDYIITVEYGDISDSVTIRMNSEYFNFEMVEPVYTPDPVYPNHEDGGLISFKISTEDIKNVIIGSNGMDETAKKHDFARNSVITDQFNNDVTSYFKISANNLTLEPSATAFNLDVSFTKNAVEPGLYLIKTYYGEGTNLITKTQYFVIGDYIKDFKLGEVETITTTDDGRIHKNIGGIYRLHYSSDFDISASDLSVKIKTAGIEIPNDVFEIDLYDTYIDVKYKAKEPYLSSGDYEIEVIYQSDENIEPYKDSKTVHLYGTYKKIKIANINTESEIIYADKESQFYTFDVDTNTLDNTDITNMRAEIYDSKGNLVYSNKTGVNVVNKFEVINNLNNADHNYRINILAFKAIPDTYKIALYLADEDGEYNKSNDLEFTIDTRYYRVNLSNESKFSPKFVYQNDENSIYDVDGASGFYKFTSNYPGMDTSIYSVKILQENREIKEIKDLNISKLSEYGVNYLIAEFDIQDIPEGNYEVYICINGLPYTFKEIKIKRYIAVSKVEMVIDGKIIKDKVTMYMGQKRKVSFNYEPANATNPNFTYSVMDNSIANIINNEITITGEGTTTIKLSGRDIEISAVLNTEQRLTSPTYEITYDDNALIYVGNMKTKLLTTSQFISNLDGLVDNYQILDKNGRDVTKTASYIGTGYTLVNGQERFKISVIGDVNGDGKITVADVAYVYQYVLKNVNITDKSVLKAASILKKDIIRVSDVAKLYQFVYGTIKEI